ncbi:uncharacterized protein LOC117180359 [Belonocnema kinseyi]|uniref:uncharacterized protein LOC117180359 n=1 Tax=Belonocnema kinseyi TaxID=2817044 RepID=UPI00143D7172|nr:uncharacterized protein LOC117180359 [Belonocnema kinseyi]
MSEDEEESFNLQEHHLRGEAEDEARAKQIERDVDEAFDEVVQEFSEDTRYYQCSTENCYATAYMNKTDRILTRGRIEHSHHCLSDGKDDEILMREWMIEELKKSWWKLLSLYEEALKSQRLNFRFSSTLPRYKTVLRDDLIKKAWIDLINSNETNLELLKFLDSIASSKGKKLDKIMQVEDRYQPEYVLQEAPLIEPIETAIDYDVELGMTDFERLKFQREQRAQRRLRREREKNTRGVPTVENQVEEEDDRHVPHFYRRTARRPPNVQFNVELEDNSNRNFTRKQDFECNDNNEGKRNPAKSLARVDPVNNHSVENVNRRLINKSPQSIDSALGIENDNLFDNFSFDPPRASTPINWYITKDHSHDFEESRVEPRLICMSNYSKDSTAEVSNDELDQISSSQRPVVETNKITKHAFDLIQLRLNSQIKTSNDVLIPHSHDEPETPNSFSLQSPNQSTRLSLVKEDIVQKVLREKNSENREITARSAMSNNNELKKTKKTAGGNRKNKRRRLAEKKTFVEKENMSDTIQTCSTYGEEYDIRASLFQGQSIGMDFVKGTQKQSAIKRKNDYIDFTADVSL